MSQSAKIMNNMLLGLPTRPIIMLTSPRRSTGPQQASGRHDPCVQPPFSGLCQSVVQTDRPYRATLWRHVASHDRTIVSTCYHSSCIYSQGLRHFGGTSSILYLLPYYLYPFLDGPSVHVDRPDKQINTQHCIHSLPYSDSSTPVYIFAITC